MQQKKIKEFILAITKEKIKWDVPLGLYSDLIDNETIRLLSKSGIASITLAVESGSEKVLHQIMKKRTNLKNIITIREEAKKYNLRVIGAFIIGILGETKKDLLETINFIEKVKFDNINLLFALPLSGTKFYEESREKGYLPKDYSTVDETMQCKYILNIPKGSPDYIMESHTFNNLIGNISKAYNTPLNSDHWLRCKNMVKYHQPGGQDEKEEIGERI